MYLIRTILRQSGNPQTRRICRISANPEAFTVWDTAGRTFRDQLAGMFRPDRLECPERVIRAVDATSPASRGLALKD